MSLEQLERSLTRSRDAATSATVAAASLAASFVWLVLHDHHAASRAGTAMVVVLPVIGLGHAVWRRTGLARTLANAFALLVALVIAVVLIASWPGPPV